MENSEVVCKHCQSKNTRKYGLVEGTQRYFCNDCRRKFSADDRLFRMKTPANQVSSALDMYYSGSSINDIRNHLEQQHGNRPSSKSVYGWIDKYSVEAIKQFEGYHPQVGDVWTADETVLKINGQNVWMYDIIDEETRFLLASRLALSRTTHDAEMLMKEAEKKAGKIPKAVITDKNNSYLDGIELAFGADSEHIQGKPFSGQDDTQRIERFHGTIKDRTKVMRGLKSTGSAIQFMDGFLVYYNYLRPHESLEGKTPAEAGKVDYPSKSWMDITRAVKPRIVVLTTPATVSILGEGKPFIRTPEHRHYNVELRRKQRIARKVRLVKPHHAKWGEGFTRRSDR